MSDVRYKYAIDLSYSMGAGKVAIPVQAITEAIAEVIQGDYGDLLHDVRLAVVAGARLEVVGSPIAWLSDEGTAEVEQKVLDDPNQAVLPFR